MTAEERGCQELPGRPGGVSCSLGPLPRGLPPAVAASPGGAPALDRCSVKTWEEKVPVSTPTWWFTCGRRGCSGLCESHILVRFTACSWLWVLQEGSSVLVFGSVACLLPGWVKAAVEGARPAAAQAVVSTRRRFPRGKNTLCRTSVSGDSASPQQLCMRGIFFFF